MHIRIVTTRSERSDTPLDSHYLRSVQFTLRRVYDVCVCVCVCHEPSESSSDSEPSDSEFSSAISILRQHSYADLEPKICRESRLQHAAQSRVLAGHDPATRQLACAPCRQ